MVSVIQQQQIDQLNINPKECIEWVKQGFLMKDEVQMPAKLSVHPQGEDFMTSMPCLLPKHDGKKYFGINTDDKTPFFMKVPKLINAALYEIRINDDVGLLSFADHSYYLAVIGPVIFIEVSTEEQRQKYGIVFTSCIDE